VDATVRLWLARLCESIEGASAALVVRADSDQGRMRSLAAWPDNAAADEELVNTARLVFQRKRAVVREAGADGDAAKQAFLGMPLPGKADLPDVIAIRWEPSERVDSELVARLLRAGAAGLELASQGGDARSSLVALLDFVRLVLDNDGFDAAAGALVTELATHLGCERVSIGFNQRGQMRVEALSHSARFDARAQLLRDLGLAMDEAGDQDAVIVHPAREAGSPRVERAHEELLGQHGAGCVCTVPLASRGVVVGALCFEWADGAAPDADALRLCEDVAVLSGRILELRRIADRRVLERWRELSRSHLARLRGPGHAAYKLGAAAVVLGLGLLLLAPTTYRVNADARLEGRVQRAIVAGFEGYIAEANARAGDIVRKGQVLGTLDERDLGLVRGKLAARRAQVRKEYREAVAAHDRAQVAILSAKVAQADAQLKLIEEQFARTRLVAPFDGVVVKGDLSQSLGSPVERGDVLFEVAPLEGYRIMLSVDERDIRDIAVGHHGELTLAALPGEHLPLTIERVTPVAAAEDGHNFFRVEASLEHPPDSLRPGMEGVAKIRVGRRRLIWIWTHDSVDWLRLRAWSWLP